VSGRVPLPSLGRPSAKTLVDATSSVGRRARVPLEAWYARSSLVGTEPFLDTATFPWIAELEARWLDIRAELDDLLAEHDALPNFQDISVDQQGLTDDDRWKTYFLFGYGVRADTACERCPRTAALLEAVPGLKTAFFSILSPRKHIPPHRGPFRGVLRYHLGLRVPDPPQDCRIRVGDELRHWEEGRSLLFDDTYEHEVLNDTDQYRAVLFVDVVRPLRQPAAAVNRAVIRAIAASPFVQDAKRRQEAWERARAAGTGNGSPPTPPR
jgi:ornithine lipid ester-linked acyl 2-hydroxylase